MPIVEALESYLLGAPVEHVRPLDGGVGHPYKLALILRGGVGVVAKLGNSEQMMRQARREVAAWLLAVELGLARLVPATVLRQIPTSGNPSTPTLEGSVQILWPRFRMALEDPIKPESCSKAVSWPIAVFDLLLANTDRKADNWGTIDGLPRAVLIDHGHAFEAADSQSVFVEIHRDQPVPRGLLRQIESFSAGQEHSRLRNVLDGTECDAVFDRASRILKHKTLTIR
ncbi:MAG: hypothetical protein ABSB69_17025 [Solirubrobacteraceae bacterium]